jgi:hypothetical protein
MRLLGLVASQLSVRLLERIVKNTKLIDPLQPADVVPVAILEAPASPNAVTDTGIRIRPGLKNLLWAQRHRTPMGAS